MFSGIIQSLGTLVQIPPVHGGVLVVNTRWAHNAVLGSSIAVNGVCLTLVYVAEDVMHFDVSAETLRCTTLSNLPCNARVNLEPALRMGDMLDGHLVSGHVDAVGEIRTMKPQGKDHLVHCAFPRSLAPFIAVKGSICIDGVSLTVNKCQDQILSVNLIPYTFTHTCCADYGVGSKVNLEVDLIARYVQRSVLPYG